MSARALFGTRRDETTAMRRKQLRQAKHCGTIDQTQTCLCVQHARCPRTKRGRTAIQTTSAGRNVAALASVVARAIAMPGAHNLYTRCLLERHHCLWHEGLKFFKLHVVLLIARALPCLLLRLLLALLVLLLLLLLALLVLCLLALRFCHHLTQRLAARRLAA